MDEVERIQEAVEQLVELRMQRRKDARAVSEIEEEEDRLLSNLLSQLAAVKGGGSRGRAAAVPPLEKDELAAELRKLRRQNIITHILLATMIIVTGTWQLSEASLILSFKNKFTNPFKSAANLIGRVLKGGGQSLTELHSLSLETNSLSMEGSILPQLTIPPVLNLQNPLEE